MNKLALLIWLLLTGVGFAQQFHPSMVSQTLGDFINTSNVAQTSGYGQSGRIYEKSSSYLYADHAQNNPYYQGAFVRSYISNNQNLMNPRLNHIYTYFEGRRMNGYYRDMEEWRRQERLRLKKYGLYDREAIEDLYRP